MSIATFSRPVLQLRVTVYSKLPLAFKKILGLCRTAGLSRACVKRKHGKTCIVTATSTPLPYSPGRGRVYVPASPLTLRLEDECQTPEDVMQLYLNSSQITASDVASVFKRLYGLHGLLSTRKRTTMPQIVEPLMEGSQSALRFMAADELVVVLRAVSRLQPRLTTRWILLLLVALRLKLPSLSPRQLMRVVQGLAKLPLDWEDLHEELHGFLAGFAQISRPKLAMFKTDELALMVCALADLGYPPPKEWLNDYCRVSLAKMDSFQTHFLARMLAAFAKMGFRPDSQWLAAYYQHLRQQLPLFDPGDLATTVLAVAEHQTLQPTTMQDLMLEINGKLETLDSWALGRLVKALVVLGRTPDPSFMAKLEQRLHASLPQFKSWVLAEVVWSLGQLRHRPSPAFMQAAVEATGRCLALGRSTSRFMHATPFVRLLLGFASLQQPLPWEWLEDYAYLAQRRISEGSHMCEVVHGFSELGFQPPMHLLNAWVQALNNTEALEHLSPQHQYHLLFGLARIGYRPPPEWLRRFCLATFSTQLGCKTQVPPAEPLANTLWALGVLGYSPPANWLSDALVAAQCQSANFQPVHLARMLWAVARMGYQPSTRWLLVMADQLEQLLGSCRPAELGECVLALAMLGLRPTPQWLHAVAGAVAGLQGGLTEEQAGQVVAALRVLQGRVVHDGEGLKGQQQEQGQGQGQQMPSSSQPPQAQLIAAA